MFRPRPSPVGAIQGLVSRRYVSEGRKRIGFLHSSVERFVCKNRERVKRGERFSQMTNEELGRDHCPSSLVGE